MNQRLTFELNAKELFLVETLFPSNNGNYCKFLVFGTNCRTF